MMQLYASDLLCHSSVASDLHYLGSSLSAAAVGLCNMMLHMFHMNNYTIQKEEGRGSVRVRRKGRRRRTKNNNEEDEHSGHVWGDEDEKEGNEIERILSSVPVPSVYINKWDQPCSLCLLISIPTVLQSIQIDCDSCRLWPSLKNNSPPRLLGTFWWFGLEVTQAWTA